MIDPGRFRREDQFAERGQAGAVRETRLRLAVRGARGPLSVRFSGLAASSSWTTGSAIRVWNAATGQQVLTLRGHTAQVYSAAWNPDGQRLASGGHDQTIRVWDLATKQEALKMRGHTEVVSSVAWSPDAHRLASSSWDGTIRIWNPATGDETIALDAHTAPVWWLAWSPDGQRLASASADQTIKIWDASRGYELVTQQP